jgi:SPP1 family predicted phage head-tail adaptor
MARINAGKYRHLVTFQRLKEPQNLYGETSVNIESNWEDAFTARVGIFPLSGRELLALEADAKQGEISHRIVLRYMKGIDSKMRIKFGTRIFEIISPPVNNYERNDELLLFCKERDVLATGVNIYG